MCAATTCSDSNSLPKTEFGYPGASPSFARERIPAADPLREHLFVVPDFDGDGTRDMVRETWQHRWGSGDTPRVLELSGGARVSAPPTRLLRNPVRRRAEHQARRRNRGPDAFWDTGGERHHGHLATRRSRPAPQSRRAAGDPGDEVRRLRRRREDGRAAGRAGLAEPDPLRAGDPLPVRPSANGQLQFCRGTSLGGLGAAFDDCEMLSAAEDFDGRLPDLLTDQDPPDPAWSPGAPAGVPGPPCGLPASRAGRRRGQRGTSPSRPGWAGEQHRPRRRRRAEDARPERRRPYGFRPPAHGAPGDRLRERGRQRGWHVHPLPRRPIWGVGTGAALASLLRWPDLNHKVKVRRRRRRPGGTPCPGGAEGDLVPGAWDGGVNSGSSTARRATTWDVPNLSRGLDRAIYRWDIVSLDLDANGLVWANQRWSDLEVPITRSREPAVTSATGSSTSSSISGPPPLPSDHPARRRRERLSPWKRGGPCLRLQRPELRALDRPRPGNGRRPLPRR